MSGTTTLTADDFDFIWNAADRIRDRSTSLRDISDAMTTLGLHEVAIKISNILNEIEDDATEIQRALVDGHEGEEPPFSLGPAFDVCSDSVMPEPQSSVSPYPIKKFRKSNKEA